MPNNSESSPVAFKPGFFLFASTLLIYPFSRSILSILVAMMGVGLIYEYFNKTLKLPKFAWFYMVYVLTYAILDLFQIDHGMRATLLKIPIPILMIFVLSRQWKPSYWEYALLFLALTTTVLGVVSVSGYYLNKEEMDVLLLQSKAIPIFTGMHHIQFGVIHSLVVGLLIIKSVFYLASKPWVAYVQWAFALIGLFNLHILSSRTGLMGFYFGLMAVIAVFTLQSTYRKTGVYALAGVVVFVGLNLMFNQSFINKYQNSKNDFNALVEGGEGINFNSMAMRVEAYKTASTVLIYNPIGCGIYNVKAKMDQGYNERNSVLIEENRIMPHNQFLEEGIKLGWFGVILILLLFYPLVTQLQKGIWQPMVLFGAIVLFISFLLESQLERQFGIFTFGVFAPIVIQFSRNFSLKSR